MSEPVVGCGILAMFLAGCFWRHLLFVLEKEYFVDAYWAFV
jgi:hypothetical protein